MKRVAVLGHFGFGTDKANGQTIKTKTVGKELKRQVGDDQVDYYDTMGGWKFLARMPFVIFQMLRQHRNIVVLPAYKGVRVILPCLVLFNLFYHRKLHYVIIGGWLPDFAKKYPILRWTLRRIDVLYPETLLIQQELQPFGLRLICQLPNSKQLDIVSADDLRTSSHPPFKVCTFSRITRTKGVLEAIEAVKQVNKQVGQELYQLDIYGLIEDKEWFNELMSNQPDYIHYCGIVAFNDSVMVLRNYFTLLFPTYHAGEGFAGTLIDSHAAGLPPIVTRWRSNTEVITDGVTGFVIEPCSVDELAQKLLLIGRDPSLVDRLRPACVRQAALFQPESAIKPLVEHLD